MRKALIFLCVLALIVVGMSPVFAFVRYNQNIQSPEAAWFPRGASLDVDAAYYNPAGTALLKDGLYIQLVDIMVFNWHFVYLCRGNTQLTVRIVLRYYHFVSTTLGSVRR